MPILYDKTSYNEFFTKYDLGCILVVDIRLQESEYNTIFEQTHLKPMLFITEPIKHFSINGAKSCIYSYKAVIENKFPYLFGCINHDPKNGRYKFPLYMFIPSFDYKNKYYYNHINYKLFKHYVMILRPYYKALASNKLAKSYAS